MTQETLNNGEFTTPIVGVSLYKNVFNPLNFIDLLESRCADTYSDLEWSWATTGDGSGVGKQSEYRSSMNCSLHSLMHTNDDEQEAFELFSSSIKDRLRIPLINYQTQYRIESALAEPYQVLKYVESTGYRAHYDSGRASSRTFSLVASLAEAEEGGELEFPFFNYKVKLSIGDVIIFPSNHPYTHIAHPVYSGTKYSLVSWFA